MFLEPLFEVQVMDISYQVFSDLRRRMFQEWLFEVQDSQQVFSALTMKILRAWIWRMDIVYLMIWGEEGILDIEVVLMTRRLLASNAPDELRGPTMHGILEIRSFS